MKEDTKRIIDNEKIFHNGLANTIKGLIYELEPELFELAKRVDENTSVEVEIRLVDSKGKVVEMEDPFEQVKVRKKK